MSAPERRDGAEVQTQQQQQQPEQQSSAPAADAMHTNAHATADSSSAQAHAAAPTASPPAASVDASPPASATRSPPVTSTSPGAAATLMALAGDSSPSPSPPISAPRSPPQPPPLPSRRVRMYSLRADGQWVDGGIGWLWMGQELPLADPNGRQGALQTHVLIKQEAHESTEAAKAGGEGAAAAAAAGSASAATPAEPHPPVTSLGLPSMRGVTLLALHVPSGSHFQAQGESIITFTMPADQQPHAPHGQAARVLHAQQEQLQHAEGGVDASAAAADAPLPPLPSASISEIDVALSFQAEADAKAVWAYIHSFPEVIAAAAEEERRESEEAEAQEQAERDEQNRMGMMAEGDQRQAAGDDGDLFVSAHTLAAHSGMGESEEVDQLDGSGAGGFVGGHHWARDLLGSGAGGGSGGGGRAGDGEEEEDEELQQHHHPLMRTDSNSFSLFSTDSDEEDEGRGAAAGGMPFKSITAKGARGAAGKVEDEDEEEEEDFVLPESLRVATLANLPRIHAHVSHLLHPEPEPESPSSSGPSASAGGDGGLRGPLWGRLLQQHQPSARVNCRRADVQRHWTPAKKRAVFITRITEKSAAYKKSVLQFSAKKPVAIRAPPRGSSPHSAAAAASAAAGSVLSPPTTSAAAPPLPSVTSPSPVPMPAPADHNWLENLSLLLRSIDDELTMRAKAAPPADAVLPTQLQEPQPQPRAVSGGVASVGAAPTDVPQPTGTPESVAESAAAPSFSVSIGSKSDVVPSVPHAPLSLLLSSASLIHGIVSMLFAFNSSALLTYLFDTSSVHALHYQFFLILVAFEYEAAEERFKEWVEREQEKENNLALANNNNGAGSMVGGASVMSVASSSASIGAFVAERVPPGSLVLWRRHRAYLQTVMVKSPFPLALTHVLEVGSINAALEGVSSEADAADVCVQSGLSAPPTKFCLLLLSSYLCGYVRDTLVYAPRTLDDPVLGTLNSTVSFRATNALMQQLLQDEGSDGGASERGGHQQHGRRGNFRGGLMGSSSKPPPPAKRVGERRPKWTTHIFSQIRTCITEFELKQGGDAAAMAASSRSSVPVVGPVASPLTLSVVSRLTSEWCPLLPFGFCQTLPDHLYALYQLVALTKNSNTPNGVNVSQKTQFFRKLLKDGIVDCLERVLQFCQRQQNRLEAQGQIDASSLSAALPQAAQAAAASSVSSLAAGAPAFTSSLSSAQTLSWFRTLVVDLLFTLQSAQPGFIRSYMDGKYFHTDALERAVNKDRDAHHITHSRPGQRAKPHKKRSSRDEQQEHAFAVKTMHAHMARIDTVACHSSLLVLLFQLMADPHCYVGIRQNASSLLRLALDPEFSREVPDEGLRRMGGDFMSNGGGGGGSGGNPLVPLLSLGGVGSSAPKQVQLDAEEDSSDEDLMPLRPGYGNRSAEMDQRAQRKLEEIKRVRAKEARLRLMRKQQMVQSDPLLHFAYTHEGGAMRDIIRTLERAGRAWSLLQAAEQGVSSAALAAFLRDFPASLLIDCVDFLSFFCLRHSAVFRRFARDTDVVHLLARFFPEPRLTPEEIAREEAERAAAGRAKVEPSVGVKTEPGAAGEVKVEPNSNGASPSELLVMSGSPTPSPPPTAGAAVASAAAPAVAPPPLSFVPRRANLPTQLLCACLRFFRIAAEVHENYHRALQSSNILLCLLELFLANQRPNLVHSSILELVSFIDEHAILPLCGQMLHGNLYTQQMRRQEAQARSEKRKATHAGGNEKFKREDKDATSAIAVKQENGAAPEPSSTASMTSFPIYIKEEGDPTGDLCPVGIVSPSPPPLPPAPVVPPLPYMSAAYGIRRVQHLSMWPRKLRYIRIRSAAAESTQRPLPGQQRAGQKRGRDESPDDSADETEEETDPNDELVRKRLKLEHVDESSLPPLLSSPTSSVSSAFSSFPLDSPKPSSSSSSDLSSSDSAQEDSEDDFGPGRGPIQRAGQSAQRRGGHSGGMSDEEDDEDGDHTFDSLLSMTPEGDSGVKGAGCWRAAGAANPRQRQQLELEREADESFFDSWRDDPPSDVADAGEQKSSGTGKPAASLSLLARAYDSSDSSDDDEHARGATGTATAAPPAGASTAVSAPSASAAAASDSELRLEEFEARQRRARAAAAEAEEKEGFLARLHENKSRAAAAAAAHGSASVSPAHSAPGSVASSTPSSPMLSGFGFGFKSGVGSGGVSGAATAASSAAAPGAHRPVSFSFGSLKPLAAVHHLLAVAGAQPVAVPVSQTRPKSPTEPDDEDTMDM